MIPPSATAADPLPARDPKYRPPKQPVRFLTLYVPNGLSPSPAHGQKQWEELRRKEKADPTFKITSLWRPEQVGPLDTLPMILEPLAGVKREVVVISNLTNSLVENLAGCNHHPRPTGFMCCTALHGGKPAKQVDRNQPLDSGGPSIDQVLARHVGAFTRLPSLELAMQSPSRGVSSNTNENMMYGGHLSWSDRATPQPPEIDPKAVFTRLFGGGSSGDGTAKPQTDGMEDESILDAVLAQAGTFVRGLGVEDRRKMDEYLTSVRELEQRVARENKATTTPRRIDPAALRSTRALGGEIGGDPGQGKDAFQKRMRLMLDLLVHACWTDHTRIASFLMGKELGGWQDFSFIEGVKGGHHEVSHHFGDPGKREQYARICRWHVAQLAYLLERLQAIKEGGRTLLDNSIVLFGSGIEDGSSHLGWDLPVLLAGGGGGTLVGGRHLSYKIPNRRTADSGRPLANLHVEIARRMGLELTSFANSDGPLTGL